MSYKDLTFAAVREGAINAKTKQKETEYNALVPLDIASSIVLYSTHFLSPSPFRSSKHVHPLYCSFFIPSHTIRLQKVISSNYFRKLAVHSFN